VPERFRQSQVRVAGLRRPRPPAAAPAEQAAEPAHAAPPAQPHPPLQPPQHTPAPYVSREEVRATSERLAAARILMRSYSRSDSDSQSGSESESGGEAEEPAAAAAAEQEGVIPDSQPEDPPRSLPEDWAPTQPLPSLPSPGEPMDVDAAEAPPPPPPPPKELEPPPAAAQPLPPAGAQDGDVPMEEAEAEGAAVGSFGAWQCGEASQALYDGDDAAWDLMDDLGDGYDEEDLGFLLPAGRLEAENSARASSGGDPGSSNPQQQQQQPGEGGSEGVSGAPLRLFRARRPPPTQRRLDDTCWEAGILPLVHPQPHYSDPSHVPPRPPVHAGREIRVPSTAAPDLPPFAAAPPGARPPPPAVDRLRAACAAAGAGAPPRATRLLTFVPARRPPSRQATDTWLAEQHAASAAAGGLAGGGGGAGASGFTMDPNTGKLLPMDASQGSAAADDDLLGTPSLASAPLSTARPAAAAAARTPARLAAAADAADAEDEPRPASPKYDERTFFYSNPYASQQPSMRGAPGGPRPGSAASAGAPPSGTPPAPPPGPPPPRGSLRSALKAAPVAPHDSSQGSRGNRVAFPEDPPPAAAAAAVPAPKRGRPSQFVSQISAPSPSAAAAGATPSSQTGFKRTVAGKGQGLTLLSVEVHAACRAQLLPDPAQDAVHAVVLATMDDDEEMPDGQYFARVLLLDEGGGGGEGGGEGPRGRAARADALPGAQVEVFGSEAALLDAFVDAVQCLDPDILLGFEVQRASLGYLCDRAAALGRPRLLRALSRLPGEAGPGEGRADEYGWQHASGIHVAGRIVLNVWRLMRSGAPSCDAFFWQIAWPPARQAAGSPPCLLWCYARPQSSSSTSTRWRAAPRRSSACACPTSPTRSSPPGLRAAPPAGAGAASPTSPSAPASPSPSSTAWTWWGAPARWRAPSASTSSRSSPAAASTAWRAWPCA
jgi:hypothetical protein